MDIHVIKEVVSVAISQTQGLNLSQYSFQDVVNVFKEVIFYLMVIGNLLVGSFLVVHLVKYGHGSQEAPKNIAQSGIALVCINLLWIILAIILKLTGASTQVVGALN